MSNTITIELCSEDRARLDRLAEALERKTCDGCVNNALAWAEKVMRGELVATIKADEVDDVQKALAETLAKANDAVEAPKNTVETAETSTLTTTPPKEEKPKEEEPTPPPTENKVTREELKAKVINLCAKGLKAETRDIVKEYAETVRDVPEDKLTECYERLNKLEG